VSESHFTEQNYVNIPNYIKYATIHPDGRAHADSAFIVRRDIGQYKLAKYEMDHNEARNIGTEDRDGMSISAI
jgi:hypothetical protein